MKVGAGKYYYALRTIYLKRMESGGVANLWGDAVSRDRQSLVAFLFSPYSFIT
jgi:hypothetical protein